jgi:hypothetical protein
VRWFGASVILLATLWAAIAYAAVAAVAGAFGPRARLFAAPVALLTAVVVGAGLMHTPRPAERSATAQAQPVGDLPVDRVSCARRFKPVHGVVRGALDVVRTLADSVPLKDAAVLDRRAVLVLQGWGTDAVSRRPLKAVCLLVDGAPSPRERATYGISRPDVARAFGVEDLARSGFEIQIDGTDLSPGVHHLVVVGIDGRGFEEPIAKPRRVVIR